MGLAVEPMVQVKYTCSLDKCTVKKRMGYKEFCIHMASSHGGLEEVACTCTYTGTMYLHYVPAGDEGGREGGDQGAGAQAEAQGVGGHLPGATSN